jgi:hypothetical protein
MAKSTETSSTKTSSSSVLSRKVASLKKTMQKGANAITRPFKKLKKSISTASTTRSMHSAIPSPSDDEAAGTNADCGSARGSDDEIEISPEDELGTSSPSNVEMLI